MHLQTLIVACIVALCTVSSIWILMPAAARRTCARAALRLPWPAPAKLRWQRTAAAQNGCAGCRHAHAKPGPAIRVVRKSASSKHG